MKFTLKTHKMHETKPSFWIQCKGEHSGRPLKKPIPNCFAVYTEEPFLFEYCYMLWKTGKFKASIIGSVIPFIRKKEMEEVLKSIPANPKGAEVCKAVKATNDYLEHLQKQQSLYREMQKAIFKKFLNP
jgi:restriction endonuclease S subunit